MRSTGSLVNHPWYRGEPWGRVLRSKTPQGTRVGDQQGDRQMKKEVEKKREGRSNGREGRRLPSKTQFENGTFKLIDGILHKRCTGPAHEEPEYLPATEKYFHVRRTTRAGELVSRCRLCVNWAKIKSPGSHHGWVEVRDVLHFYTEAVNRVGMQELSNRTGLSMSGLANVLYLRQRYVQKANLRKVMLELISMRRKNEHSISKYAAWRIPKRVNGSMPTCARCGTLQSNLTEGCPTCWDRHNNWARRGKVA